LLGDVIMFFARSIAFIIVSFNDTKCKKMAGDLPNPNMNRSECRMKYGRNYP